MNPRLIAIEGPQRGRLFELTGEVSIGREPANTISIPAGSVSRRHCEIQRTAGGLQIRDLNSRNGTFVNGLPVTERMLAHGDEIRLGDCYFLFQSADSGEFERPRTVTFREGQQESRTMVELGREQILYLQPEAVLETAGTAPRLARDLKTLYKMGTAIQTSQGVEALSGNLLELLAEAVPASQGAVVLFEDGMEEPGWALGWTQDSGLGAEVGVDAPSLRKVREDGVAILYNEGSGGASMLAAPLAGPAGLAGAVFLESRDGRVRFDEGHLQLAAAAGRIAGVALGETQRYAQLLRENQRLNQEIRIDHGMVGESPRIRDLVRVIAKVAPAESTVLIFGESGTGKELVARAIHDNSARAEKPFVAINCAAITETLLESELFGHERGAFTGAVAQKKGKFEAAGGGTVFLDEIGELPLSLQAKLLRVLQERTCERVGGTRPIRIDVRVVAATNRDLKAAIAANNFRQDLYFRLNVVSVTTPPLRERKQDIPLLAAYFASLCAKKMNRAVHGVSPEARACLMDYDWPGNVRELQNAIERAVVLGSTDLILPEDLPEAVLEAASPQAMPSGGYHDTIRDLKRRLIEGAIERAGGNLTEAARSLGLNVTYLHRLMRNLDVRRLRVVSSA
jgi:two-component system, NtrC family, response regulator HydG